MEEVYLTTLEIGDIIIDNNMEMVVIDRIINEDYSSVSYDRQYKLCLLEELENFVNQMFLTQKEFDILGHWVKITGSPPPKIQKITNKIPFNITKETVYCINKKKPKTITIYE